MRVLFVLIQVVVQLVSQALLHIFFHHKNGTSRAESSNLSKQAVVSALETPFSHTHK